MNISQSTKHYSLLLQQDDGDTALYEGLAQDCINQGGVEESVMNGDFHAILEEDEEEEDGDDGEKEGEKEEREREDCQIKVEHEALGLTIEHDDSEEEIFSGHHRAARNEGLKLKGRQSSEYQLLSSGDTETGSGSKASADSHTPRLSAVWTPTPMSPARRACVLASVMMGVLVTAVFVWVMPCGVDDLCGINKELFMGDAPIDSYEDSWMQVFNNIGMNETLAVIKNSDGVDDILVGYYEPSNTSTAGALWSSLADCELSGSITRCNGLEVSATTTCGLMLLRGITGTKRWQMQLKECPALTMCHLMDENAVTGCLAVGSRSMVLLFDPRTGTTLWEAGTANISSTLLENDRRSLFYPGKPVLVPDVTGDLQPDLLFPGTVHSQQNDIIDDIEVHEMDAPHKIPLLKYVPDSLKFPSLSKRKNKMKKTAINEMILLSGSTGEIVGTPLKIKQCHHLTDISNDGESIDYSCLMNSGNKLAGKIPLVSLIQEIVGPQPISLNNSRSSGYPSIVPFIPTPEAISNRYCQVEVTNKGVCPLCDSSVKLMSTSEVESLWDVEYDGSKVLDWEPLVSRNKCSGLLLKVVAWDEATDLPSNLMDTVSLLNQRTTRSSFGSSDDQEEEEDAEGEEGFSAAGENAEDYSSNFAGPILDSAPAHFFLNSPNRDHFSKFIEDGRETKLDSLYYNPPIISHVRHNRIRNIHNTNNFVKLANKKFDAEFFGNRINFRKDKQTTIHEINEEIDSEPFVEDHQLPDINTNINLLDNFRNSAQREEALPISERDIDNKYVASDYRPSPLDFELPINVFGLPVDTKPPVGFTLQRLTEYIVLVQYNGSSWTDLTIKKAPIFQLCRQDSCIPNENYANKLIVKKEWGEVEHWSVVNAVSTIAHERDPHFSSNDRQNGVLEGTQEYDDKLHEDAQYNSLWSVKTFVSKMVVAP